MGGISDFMTGEHRSCDEMLAGLEQVVDGQEWEKAGELAEQFAAAMERHFVQEEQVLFPAFEERTGNTAGPTQIMREEHQQMRNLLHQLKWSVESEVVDDFLDTSETLMVMMQQHNMKEEGILYPMADEQLGTEADSVVSGMRNV